MRLYRGILIIVYDEILESGGFPVVWLRRHFDLVLFIFSNSHYSDVRTSELEGRGTGGKRDEK